MTLKSGKTIRTMKLIQNYLLLIKKVYNMEIIILSETRNASKLK